MANLPFSILNLGGRVSALHVLSSSRLISNYGLKSPSKTALVAARQMGLAPGLTDSKIRKNSGALLEIERQSHSQAQSLDHNHTKHWTAEKVLSASLIGLIPAALIYPSAPLDYALALSLTMHSHWGLEAVVVDYVRPALFGTVIPKVAVGLLYALSIAAFGGLCYFNYSDVGLAQAIHMLWKL
ncbi:hypothetical protein CHUAL_002580 [Chamberlinius hualienensis]